MRFAFQIGCGYTKWTTKREINSKLRKVYNYQMVCNYGMMQMKTRSMYKHGKACSKCPGGTKCEDLLCA